MQGLARQELTALQAQVATEAAAASTRSNALQSELDRLTAQHIATLNELTDTCDKLEDALSCHADLKGVHAELCKSHAALQVTCVAWLDSNSHNMLGRICAALMMDS